MQAGDRHAGLRGDLPGAGVDRSERVEAAQVEHDLAVERDRAADEPGVASLRARRRRRRRAQARSTAATSSTDPGRTTAGVEPEKRPVQSRTWPGDDVGIGEHVRVADRARAAHRATTRGHRVTPERTAVPRSRSCRSIPGSLRGRLLVATPPLVDPNFDRSVVLLLEHGEDGALGIILNRPTDASLASVLPDWHAHASAPGVVFSGGPVAPEAVIALARGGTDAALGLGVGARRGRHRRRRAATRPISEFPLEAMRVFVGYAGWAPGQLEAELEQDAWFVVTTRAVGSVLAAIPNSLWRDVLRRQRGRVAMFANYPADPTVN